MSTFGERLREARKHLGLTQRAFAQAVGVTQGYLSEVETGKAKASIDIAIGFALNYPGIRIDWLLTGRGSLTKLNITSEQELAIIRTFIRFAWYMSKRERFIASVAQSGSEAVILADAFTDLYKAHYSEVSEACESGVTDENRLLRGLAGAVIRAEEEDGAD